MPHHLTEDEVRRFDVDGYLEFRRRVPDPLIERLRDTARRWITMGRVAAGNIVECSSVGGAGPTQSRTSRLRLADYRPPAARAGG